jgi:hypothetical protein
VSEPTREPQAIVWPEGVSEAVVVDGVPYLEDGGPVDSAVVAGWYYGYPACCVRWFVQSRAEWRAAQSAALRAGGSVRDVARPSFGKHPVSDHLLCPACAAGEPAPLPDRPAARYGWVFIHPETDEAVFTAPHDYDRRAAERAGRIGAP